MLRRAILICAVLTACSGLRPDSARARGFNIDICPIECELAVVGVFFIPPLVFVTAEVTYAVQGRWFPLGWAIPELIYGGLMTSLLIGVSTQADDAGAAVAFTSIYGWLTLHAILSMVLDDPDERARARAARRRPTALRLSAAPVRGGALLGITGLW